MTNYDGMFAAMKLNRDSMIDLVKTEIKSRTVLVAGRTLSSEPYSWQIVIILTLLNGRYG